MNTKPQYVVIVTKERFVGAYGPFKSRPDAAAWLYQKQKEQPQNDYTVSEIYKANDT